MGSILITNCSPFSIQFKINNKTLAPGLKSGNSAGAKGLNWRFFYHVSEQAEFGLNL